MSAGIKGIADLITDYSAERGFNRNETHYEVQNFFECNVWPRHFFLDWTQRPAEIHERITQAFNNRSCYVSSQWGCYNGAPKYDLCEIDEHKLLKVLIDQAPLEQKVFYILDVGAGSFWWGKALACFINELEGMRKDITFHIVSVRAEKNVDAPIVKSGQCINYNLGSFKVEELKNSLAHFILLEGQVDLIVSRWCFRHLVDPVGTFVQTYQLLRPKTGFLLMDGFLFDPKNDENRLQGDDRYHIIPSFNYEMSQLLLDTQAPFLMTHWSTELSLNRFVLRRPNEEPCRLPMGYVGVERISDTFVVGSNCMTKFLRIPRKDEEDFMSLPNLFSGGAYHGSRELYDWLANHELIPREPLAGEGYNDTYTGPRKKWKPIYQRQAPAPKITPTLKISSETAIILSGIVITLLALFLVNLQVRDSN